MSILEQTKTDKRYSVNLEWCGHPEQRHVIRFCGSWVGQTRTNAGAWIVAANHNADRIAAMV